MLNNGVSSMPSNAVCEYYVSFSNFNFKMPSNLRLMALHIENDFFLSDFLFWKFTFFFLIRTIYKSYLNIVVTSKEIII